MFWDRDLTGPRGRVRKSGRKNYVVQTASPANYAAFTIGQHGPITLEDARAAALEILALAKKGIDPRDHDAKQAAEPVMADLGKRFLEEYVPVHCKPSPAEEHRRSVTLFIDPPIGEMRISEVQRKDIAELHHGLARQALANPAIACSSAMMAAWPTIVTRSRWPPRLGPQERRTRSPGCGR